jgi:transposase
LDTGSNENAIFLSNFTIGIEKGRFGPSFVHFDLEKSIVSLAQTESKKGTILLSNVASGCFSLVDGLAYKFAPISLVPYTTGHLLDVVVTAADLQDREGAKQVITKLPPETRAALKKIWADGNYTGDAFFNWLTATMQDVCLEIAKRPPNLKGFVVVPVRWVIERTFAWLGRSRRLSKDYEYCTKSSEGMIYFAAIALLLKRLAPAIP